MKKTEISFDSLENLGQVISNPQADGLFLSAKYQNLRFDRFDQPLKSCVRIPGRYKLPLQIDLTVRAEIPGFYLILGSGHLSFGTRQDNRSIGDLCVHDGKPRSFPNGIPLEQDTQISVIYGFKYMQIVVDGETRYLSKREKYMRAEDFPGKNNEGFVFMLAPDKLAKILVKKITLTEYDTDPALLPYEKTDLPVRLCNRAGVKAAFQDCISGLSKEIQDELLRLDHDLLSKKRLKIKRKIEGDRTGCKITYVSPIGFSYALLISEDLLHHFFWWYMVSNYKYENKYMGRKNDFMNEMIRLCDSLSPEITERLVGYFDPCVRCGEYCSSPTQYEYRDKKINSCHGKIWMNMNLQTFSDIRFLFDVLDEVLLQNHVIS